MNDEDKLKVEAKLDEMKSSRAGKTLNLQVTVSNKPELNFQHCLNEMRHLLEMHKIVPDEAHAIASQIMWMAQQAKTRIMITNTMNQFLNPKTPTHEEKVEEKLAKEKEEGIVRVKPGDDIETEPEKEKECEECKKDLSEEAKAEETKE